MVSRKKAHIEFHALFQWYFFENNYTGSKKVCKLKPVPIKLELVLLRNFQTANTLS